MKQSTITPTALNLTLIYTTALWEAHLAGIAPSTTSSTPTQPLHHGWAKAQVENHLSENPELGDLHWDVQWEYNSVDELDRPSGKLILLKLAGKTLLCDLPAGQEQHHQVMMMLAQAQGKNVNVLLKGHSVMEMWVGA